MSLSREVFQHHAELDAVCCPVHSYEQREGMLGPVLSIPAFIAGRRSGIILCSSGCECSNAMMQDAAERGMPFESVAEAEKCWALLCQQAFSKPGLNAEAGRVSDTGK